MTTTRASEGECLLVHQNVSVCENCKREVVFVSCAKGNVQ